MNNRQSSYWEEESRTVISYLAFLVIVVLLFVTFIWMGNKSHDIFHERLSRNEEVCVQEAKEDGRPADFCREAAKQAELAYSAATRFDIHYGMFLCMMLLFIFVGLITLRKQIVKLQEKKNV